MRDLVRLIVWAVVDLFRSRAAIEAEILTLRQQIIVLRRTAPKNNPLVPSTGWCSLVFIASSLAFLVRLRLLGPRPSSNGTVRASVCSGAGSRDRVVAGHPFRRKYAD